MELVAVRGHDQRKSRWTRHPRRIRQIRSAPLPRQAELRAFAAQQRLESRLVGNAFVDFHIGSRIVAAAHPAAAHAEFALDGLEQRFDRRRSSGRRSGSSL